MMLRAYITFRTLIIPERYTLLSNSKGGDNQKAAVYKRYLNIFYVRVSPVYRGCECLTIAVKEYEKLTKTK